MPRDIIRLMQALFPAAAQGCAPAGWCPAADVYRTPDGWLVKLDLAGVRPEDVRVRLQGKDLTVSGQRLDWCTEEGCRYYQMEIAYSSFERRLTLPVNLEEARVRAEHRLGMLLVHIDTEAEQ
jgi:HSP20 family protein